MMSQADKLASETEQRCCFCPLCPLLGMLASSCRQEFQALLSQVSVNNNSAFTCLGWVVLGRGIVQIGGCLCLQKLLC